MVKTGTDLPNIGDPDIGLKLCPLEMQIANHSVAIWGQGNPFHNTGIGKSVVCKMNNIPALQPVHQPDQPKSTVQLELAP